MPREWIVNIYRVAAPRRRLPVFHHGVLVHVWGTMRDKILRTMLKMDPPLQLDGDFRMHFCLSLDDWNTMAPKNIFQWKSKNNRLLSVPLFECYCFSAINSKQPTVAIMANTLY